MQTFALSNIFSLTTNKTNAIPVKLTNKVIVNVLPRSSRYAIRDSVVTGLKLHVVKYF